MLCDRPETQQFKSSALVVMRGNDHEIRMHDPAMEMTLEEFISASLINWRKSGNVTCVLRR